MGMQGLTVNPEIVMKAAKEFGFGEETILIPIQQPGAGALPPEAGAAEGEIPPEAMAAAMGGA
jgi:hypothetical protein